MTSPFLPGLWKRLSFLYPENKEEASLQGSGLKVLGTQTGPGLWGRRPWGHAPIPWSWGSSHLRLLWPLFCSGNPINLLI